MQSRATYLITSIALHIGLFVGLYILAGHRDSGVGIDHAVVELSLIPGLERLLDEAEIPTGSEDAETVAPEPAPDSADSDPERVVELDETEPPASEPEPPPAPAAREPIVAETPAEPASEPAAADPSERATPEMVQEAETPSANESLETELDPTALRAIVVSIERRAPPEPEPEPEPEPVTAAMTASEQQIIEHRVASWARSFAALSEWHPETTWVEDDQTYSASVTRVPAPDNMGVEEAVVTVTTRRDGETFSTELRMQRLGFSHFAQFIDRWDPEVQIHDDRIDGRFHSNSEIKISRSGGIQPVFHGKVTTARGIDTSSSERRVRRNEVFLGGLETRVGRIMLPRRVTIFADSESMPLDRVTRVTTDTRIEFHADGSFTSVPLDDAAQPPQQHELGKAPYYLVAEDDVELHVEGVVNGKVLVYSPETIVIDGNLVYARDPTIDPASDDYLGLVSERSVEVAESKVTGPGDLTIQASIYARRRFAVRGYSARNDGTLYVYGSVTAGSLSATEPRYSTHLSFDDRLEAARPPRFPVTDRFELSDWDGRWRIED